MQQEPRLAAYYAQDDAMIGAYKAKKDLYATMASQVYGNDYWDNMEVHRDGTPNPEGKKRRSSVKSIILGLLYGRGTPSIAEQLGESVADAQVLVDKFFKGFPTLKKWMDDTQETARREGYVEDILGRRRRLPDIQLPNYEVSLEDGSKGDAVMKFNPLLGTSGIPLKEDSRVEKYKALSKNIKSARDYTRLKEDATKEGVKIHSNTGFIAQAERQCVNARIQGGAATITKLAMIAVHNDPLLNSLGFNTLICVHDELIGECPKENADEVAKRLSEVMIEAAATVCNVPMKVDTYKVSRWYEDDFSDSTHEHYVDWIEKSGMSPESAYAKLRAENPMIKEVYLRQIADGTYACGEHPDI